MTNITELAQSLKRRATSANEFGESLYVKADDVLSLVEALEKAQQRIGKLEKKLTDHKRMNQEMAKAMLTPNDSDAAGMEIAALRQRIAELESRTVKLPEPFKLAKSLSGLTYYYADEVDAAITAAGIKVEAE
ncbi:ead/Ea22-like family protein [Klebsiella quasipneumoniae]|uniref:ead/Ea22-like family protein n=1 Tax=Klebsiella quasipneumoniae TaxID=1463165 RepID=UPI0012963B9F|nr:ead/Ea22-like family protein [Klebsiella quasipneumoniae]KAA6488123.1 hypothetical protein EHW95_15185 [Klebsiella quasipneumoniae]HCA4362301.1 ead/Ea22-like family protein [Klebsiella quasipneumoniae subsp. similipneumoniae]